MDDDRCSRAGPVPDRRRGGNVRTSFSRTSALIAASLLATTAVACSPPPKDDGGASDAAKATSVSALGGMDKLVAAAKKEGQLNVIALPPDWANYGEIVKAYTAKYGVKVNSAQPDASS